VNLLGLTPCCCICWKSYITVSSCPSFTCFVSFRLHAICWITLYLVPLQLCLLPPMVSFIGPQPKVLPMCSCVWNLDTLHLSTTRNPDQADQPCILHIPGINDIIRKEKAALTFSISILHWPTFSSLQLLLHKCKRPEMKFCTV
jgi:hypothetical protein